MAILTVETRQTSCFRCGAPIVMPKAQYEQRLDDGRSFWCPNGHEQHFTESRQAKLERCRRNRDHYQERMKHWMAECGDRDRTIQAYRMNLGKLRKRIHELESQLTATANTGDGEGETGRAP